MHLIYFHSKHKSEHVTTHTLTNIVHLTDWLWFATLLSEISFTLLEDIQFCSWLIKWGHSFR